MPRRANLKGDLMKFRAGCLGLIFLVGLQVFGQTRPQVNGQSVSGEHFVYFDFRVEDAANGKPGERVDIFTLNGGEKFPAMSSPEFARLAGKMKQIGFRIEIDASQTRLLASNLKRGEQTVEGVVRLISEYFHQPVAEFFIRPTYAQIEYKGPWEILHPRSNPGSSTQDWAASTSSFVSSFNASLRMEDPDGDGKKTMVVLATSWRPRQTIRQEFDIQVIDGKPVITRLQWVYPGPCGSNKPSRTQPNIWGQFEKYVGDLPPAMQSYFGKGTVNAQLEKLKAVPQNARAKGPC